MTVRAAQKDLHKPSQRKYRCQIPMEAVEATIDVFLSFREF